MDIASFVLQQATFPHPTSSLPKIPPVPLGVGGYLWAPKNEVVGLIVGAISFQDFQPMWSWSTNVTDRQTGGQTDRRHALHYSAFFIKKM